MVVEIKIPSPGESINEVTLANWLIEDGEYVEKNQEIAEVESDKATLPLIAPEAGKITIIVKEGETIQVGTVACKLDTKALDNRSIKKDQPKLISEGKNEGDKLQKTEKQKPIENNKKEKITVKTEKEEKSLGKSEYTSVKITPLAKNLMEMNDLSVDDIIAGMKKITTKEVNQVISLKTGNYAEIITEKSRESQTTKMSQLRKKLGQRLVAVKNETAMLTTFNELDITEVMALRKIYQDEFTRKHGIKLGLMSFFIKASTIALRQFSKVNSRIEGDNIVTPAYVDVCIAVQTTKGLMVPVIRNTETMNLALIELKIAELAEKARNFKITIEEMTGGTFTITNGGVFGSMLSTPIINPPQSAILGMHNIVERAVVINGKIEIRPVMYIALSYDHRLIDGSESVTFLVKIKELIENPSKMIVGGETMKVLLGIE